MWSFLVDLFRRADVPHTIMVMEAEAPNRARRYQITPQRLFVLWGGSLIGIGLLVAGLFSFTPLRSILPPSNAEQIRRNAQLTALRVEALEDSMAVQRQYIGRLQQLITGRVDSSTRTGSGPARKEPRAVARTRPPGSAAEGSTRTGGSLDVMPEIFPSSMVLRSADRPDTETDVSRFGFPADPPVSGGFPTRGFDAQSGHYGIDIAVTEGTSVRAVRPGYVVMADWTQDGGYTIAVQHANGYLTIYKHNKRLLKQVGDRVSTGEALATSGNTGENTTGPHLHFELWRNGLVYDPRPYIRGW